MIGSRACSLVERYGVTLAAERIVDMFEIDCLAAVVRALEDVVSKKPVKKEPKREEEDDDEGVESDEQREVDDEDDDEACESRSDHEPERVEYLRSDMVTVGQAHLADDDLDDGKPPMRLRRLDNGELLRASRHRVLRGAERRGVYEMDGKESVSDARGSLRQTGMLGGGGAKGALPDFRASVARGRSGAASGVSRPTEGSGTVDQSSTREVDLFANWGSVRSDGSHRTRTPPGVFGRECAASDDGSRVSELTDGSRPSVRSGMRSMLGSLADHSPVERVLVAWVEPRSILAMRRRACRW